MNEGNEGSHVGNAALTELARGLGIPSVALKVVLEEALDTMKENEDPSLLSGSHSLA
jgi:hypothetical protein